MAYVKKLFPQVQEFFFDDDTFTANLPRAREIAKKLAPARPHLVVQQPREPGLRHDQILQGLRPAPVPGRLRKRQPGHPQPHQERRDDGRSAAFTKACHEAGVVIHGTFILGLPVETQRNHRANDPFRDGTGRVQHPSFAGRAVSRHGALRHGPAKRLVRQEGQDRHRAKTTASSKARSNIPA